MTGGWNISSDISASRSSSDMRCHHKQESLSNKHACENYLRHNFKSMVLWTSYVSPSEIMEDKFLIDHNLIMLLRKGHTAHYCIYHCMYSTNELLASMEVAVVSCQPHTIAFIMCLKSCQCMEVAVVSCQCINRTAHIKFAPCTSRHTTLQVLVWAMDSTIQRYHPWFWQAYKTDIKLLLRPLSNASTDSPCKLH